jgi:hypothetical protein
MLPDRLTDLPDTESSDHPGPVVSVADAAHLCEVSADTIRRRLHAGVFAGAYRDGPTDHHPWLIPVDDLVRANMRSPTVVLDLYLDLDRTRLLRRTGLSHSCPLTTETSDPCPLSPELDVQVIG